MISFVVCLYRPELYAKVCEPALTRQAAMVNGEIILESSEIGICEAYEKGRRKARHRTIVYLHDDLELMDADAAIRILQTFDGTRASLLGVVGSGIPADGRGTIPWWKAQIHVGAWLTPNEMGGGYQYNTGSGVTRWDGVARPPLATAHVLDGIVLADRSNLPWPRMSGWHGYDVDRCLEVASRRMHTVAGDLLVCHHGQPHAPGWREALKPRLAELAQKWNVACG